MRHLIVGIAAGCLAMGGLTPAAAQQSRQSQVAEVHARALELQQNQGTLVAAAHLYQREAALRGDDDPQCVKALRVAAHLLYYARHRDEARQVMEEAGDIALAEGDVTEAARNFVLTAWMAQNDHRPEESRRLAHRAEMLAASPLLATHESAAILSRVRQVNTIGLR